MPKTTASDSLLWSTDKFFPELITVRNGQYRIYQRYSQRIFEAYTPHGSFKTKTAATARQICNILHQENDIKNYAERYPSGNKRHSPINRKRGGWQPSTHKKKSLGG